MAKVLNIRGLELGAGKPKVIVSIAEASYSDIIAKAADLASQPLDMVEWRADFFDEVYDTERVLLTLAELRAILPDTPLLFTFRTKKEGGAKDILWAYYTVLNKTVAKSGNADLIDIEVFIDDQLAAENIANIQDAGVLVVGSYHDFLATSPQDEIVARLNEMQDTGADIIKMAVMPRSAADVLALLGATAEMWEEHARCPLITMAMSDKGLISRIVGEAFGSAATFGAVGRESAPGQLPLEQLVQVLDALHEALNKKGASA